MLCRVPNIKLLHHTELCDSKQFLPFTYQTNRSVNYNETTTLSDRFMREGWYGTFDFIIPTVKPASRHCGAKYPIFLQSEPAQERIIVDVTACIRDCTNPVDIKALKCSDRLTVYKLLRPPTSDAAYCLDGLEADPLNFRTNATVNTNLRLVPGSDFEEEFIFECVFPNPRNSSLTYKATWFVDDVVVFESQYTDYNDVNKIRSFTDTRLRDNNITTLGFQLRCDIKAAMMVGGTQRKSLPSSSKQKIIGIIVWTPVLKIKEGEKAKIMIKSTVPIGCAEPEGCTLTITADIPQEGEDQCEPTPTANGGCGISIKASEWNEFYHLEITSTITEDYGQTVTQKKVFLRTQGLYFGQRIWQNYFLEPVTINIVKNTSLIEGKLCQIHNDPYLKDFYSSTRRSIQLAGTFYLLQMDNVEVQVNITACTRGGGGSCVCGVVVRVGRTAFMINHCNLQNWYIDYILCDDGGDILDVRKKYETKFEIYLPSDTKIQIDVKDRTSNNWLNIYINPSVRDIGKTFGLCGELTIDSPAVQYNGAYFNSLRVKADMNLFNPGNWKALPEWTPTDTNRFEHCRCDEKDDDKIDTTLNCTRVPGATTCSPDEDYDLFHKKRCINPSRKKRSLPRGSQPQILHHRRLRRDVSWKNGWTMDSANEYCSGLFNNSMVIKRCEGIRGINIEGAIETCFSDIQVIQDMKISFTKLGEEKYEVCLQHELHVKSDHADLSDGVTCDRCSTWKRHNEAAASARAHYQTVASNADANILIRSVDLQKVIMLPHMPAQDVTLRYFETGHTFMSADSVHHQVEQQMNRQQGGKVLDFPDFADVVSRCSNVEGLQMSNIDFRDWSPIHSAAKMKKSGIKLTQMVEIKVKRGSKTLSYKLNHDDPEFMELDFTKKGAMLVFPKRLRRKNRGIPLEKKTDIVEMLCPMMPTNRRIFWTSFDIDKICEDLINESTEKYEGSFS
ncbi:hypothetical protein LOTGIDRAFT_175170 [Lottia gigantea]|uniref:Vwde helical domain-containing protein n=1 Tax=Lottia gigantea TaxID=225164 RepID=V4AEE9_LOTGI|nr:hypothetical protein LOTGIDRAFT_175170 [Lottia gigantea]ESO95262.1 hypothetical protein LOTGIDRAFT_175170 [Lottia gigantea]